MMSHCKDEDKDVNVLQSSLEGQCKSHQIHILVWKVVFSQLIGAHINNLSILNNYHLIVKNFLSIKHLAHLNWVVSIAFLLAAQAMQQASK